MSKAYMLYTQEMAESKYKKWEKEHAPAGWDGKWTTVSVVFIAILLFSVQLFYLGTSYIVLYLIYEIFSYVGFATIPFSVISSFWVMLIIWSVLVEFCKHEQPVIVAQFNLGNLSIYTNRWFFFFSTVFSQRTLYNAYKKRTKNIKVDLDAYNKLKEENPEFYGTASCLQYGKVSI